MAQLTTHEKAHRIANLMTELTHKLRGLEYQACEADAELKIQLNELLESEGYDDPEWLNDQSVMIEGYEVILEDGDWSAYEADR